MSSRKFILVLVDGLHEIFGSVWRPDRLQQLHHEPLKRRGDFMHLPIVRPPEKVFLELPTKGGRMGQ